MPPGAGCPKLGRMPLPYPALKPCPCQSGRSFASCCQPALNAERAAQTPEALMRSRYVAYALQDEAYLRRTWAAETCPDDLEATDGTRYQGLRIHRAEGDTVEFSAKLKLPDGRRGTLRERSTFEQRGGEWVYVDGVVLNSQAGVTDTPADKD